MSTFRGFPGCVSCSKKRKFCHKPDFKTIFMQSTQRIAVRSAALPVQRATRHSRFWNNPFQSMWQTLGKCFVWCWMMSFRLVLLKGFVAPFSYFYDLRSSLLYRLFDPMVSASARCVVQTLPLRSLRQHLDVDLGNWASSLFSILWVFPCDCWSLFYPAS